MLEEKDKNIFDILKDYGGDMNTQYLFGLAKRKGLCNRNSSFKASLLRLQGDGLVIISDNFRVKIV